MAVIQCKICGGEVDITPGLTMGECPYCHTVTTFPRFKFQGIETLYRRAEEARRSGNYDKAISVYEEIINSDNGDPEAYWGLVLSTWGIEYVEDPLTKERKPTCHRVQFESILDDANFKKALEISSGGEAEIYKQEALKIAEIQKNILKISAQEKPFDIFICYKESDESGQRTPDSVFAQELYGTLSAKGYKVFFARVTLEDKVGLYEPYIFSALNSAKVMLVIGSKKEYFEAVWVRNEWSRFLRLMKNDRSKLLIPCYRDMDAYELPEELTMLQSQDMGKIGFLQDVARGIDKVLNKRPGTTQKSSNVGMELPLSEASMKGADDMSQPIQKINVGDVRSYISGANRWFIGFIICQIVLVMCCCLAASSDAACFFMFLTYPASYFVASIFLTKTWNALKMLDQNQRGSFIWFVWMPFVRVFTLIPFNIKISNVLVHRNLKIKSIRWLAMIAAWVAPTLLFFCLVPSDPEAEAEMSDLALLLPVALQVLAISGWVWEIKKNVIRILEQA